MFNEVTGGATFVLSPGHDFTALGLGQVDVQIAGSILGQLLGTRWTRSEELGGGGCTMASFATIGKANFRLKINSLVVNFES